MPKRKLKVAVLRYPEKYFEMRRQNRIVKRPITMASVKLNW
jgi:hypothetical protein